MPENMQDAAAQTILNYAATLEDEQAHAYKQSSLPAPHWMQTCKTRPSPRNRNAKTAKEKAL